MKVAEYIVNYLVQIGVTDAFGIPGGVVLDFLYALDREKRIKPHLSYHEQGAAFEACGYAQYEHKLGIAYATRGPGFTNLITGIADAYADSIPVLFITAHSGKTVGQEQRFEKDQELNVVSMVRHITKFARCIDDVKDVCESIQTACRLAVTGRKGPVLLDISSTLWNREIIITENETKQKPNATMPVQPIIDALRKAKRPILLVGDGVRQANAVNAFASLCRQWKIPVLSSRCSQDVGIISERYYGYVGSHGIRYSNFIFAKADLVISLGNRFGFPLDSKSFIKALGNKKIYRIENDVDELKRNIPNAISFECDVQTAIAELAQSCFTINNNPEWISVCNELKKQLKSFDRNKAIEELVEVFNKLDQNITICCDVGNHEFWVSRAYVEAGIKNRILYSKSFGALGCAIPKAIGTAKASGNSVICIIGDQGLQLNMQELQLIVQEQIPVCILVVNNKSSGMIRSKQKVKYNGHYVHTTITSGYGCPDIEAIAKAYHLQYENIVSVYPSIVEIKVDEKTDLEPSLPANNDIQDMEPFLNRKLYESFQKL